MNLSFSSIQYNKSLQNYHRNPWHYFWFTFSLFVISKVDHSPLTAGKVEVLVIILIKFLTTEKYNHETFKYGSVLTLHRQFECHRTLMECHSISYFSNNVSLLYFTNRRQNYEYKINLTDKNSLEKYFIRPNILKIFSQSA